MMRILDQKRAAALALSYFLGGVIKRPLPLPTAKMKPEKIWRCSEKALVSLLGLRPSEGEQLTSFRRGFSVNRIEHDLRKNGIEYVALGDDLYPSSLARIYDPPPGLFITGKYPAGAAARLQEFMSGHRIAIVGARAASRYGLDAAGLLAEGLSRQAVCVISGLALGIDAAAHRGAFDKEGGSMAVLGCGVDVVYPAANRSLYRDLLKFGVVASEYPPGTSPRPWRFPARNRIIAGLAQGVVVVEAKDKSGALITADFCLEQGKEVYAVPGSIFSDLSAGPNRLIRLGAIAATAAEDILENMGIETKPDENKGQEMAGLTDDEMKIYKVLDRVSRHPDELAVKAGLDIRPATAALVSLEIKGLARQAQGFGYSR